MTKFIELVIRAVTIIIIRTLGTFCCYIAGLEYLSTTLIKWNGKDI
jgi:hypothetical protein